MGYSSLCNDTIIDELFSNFMDEDNNPRVCTNLEFTDEGRRGLYDSAKSNLSSSSGYKDDESHDRKLLQLSLAVHYPPRLTELPNASTAILLPTGIGDAADNPPRTSASIPNHSNLTTAPESLTETMEPPVLVDGATVIPTYGVVCLVRGEFKHTIPFNYTTLN